MALITASLFMRLCLCASTILLVGANSHHHQQQEEAVIDAAQGTVVHINSNDNNDNSQGTSNNKNNEEYGVDASWPMHHHSIPITPADLDHHRPNNNPLGAEARQSAYQEYLQGCLIGNAEEEEEETEKFSASPSSASCRRFEADRIAMNLQQPAISQNYTHAGFAKVETPPAVLQLLQEIWEEENEDASSSSSSSSKVLERWERGNTYLNHWHSPTYMIDITQILSTAEQRQLVQAVQSVLEAWTQQPLVLTSLYGIRIYGNEAVLSSHVDRLPLVSSAIINVAQDVEEPWPLEVIGHDGKAHNVTMEPGDMVLYESHSVIHGRPFPLKGKYYANVFVHFEPLGHSFRHIQNSPHHQETAQATYERALAYHQQQQQQSQTKKVVMMNNQQHSSPRMQQKAQYDEAILNDHGAAPTAALPYYVPPDKEVRWRQQFEYEKEPEISPKPTRATLGSINPHFAAADGALDLLKEIAAKDRSQLFKSDPNGWRPLHEAARGGHAHVVAYLLHEGAQVNERANHGEGGSPLWWAERNAKKNSKTIKVLKQHGGVSLAPLPAEARKNSAGTGTDTSNQKKAK